MAEQPKTPTLAKPISNKIGFHGIKEFYNFLKESNNHAPSAHKISIMTLYEHNGNKPVIDSSFFDYFSFYVQQINSPELTTATTPLQSPIGNFTYLNNVSVNSSENSVQITFMDTENSIHEHAFYGWMEQISNYETPFIPRLDMAIKVYFSDIRILENGSTQYEHKLGYSLNFIYFFSGCFPIHIESYNLKQNSSDAGDFSRPVKFSFNNMVVLHNKPRAELVGLGHLWTNHVVETKLTEKRTTTRRNKTNKTRILRRNICESIGSEKV